MSKIKQVSSESAISPNLVPMVDIMFLLLLFLMVGADMGQRELEEVHLPIAASVKEENPNATDAEGEGKRLTLNVYHTFEGGCAPFASKPYLCGDKTHWAIGIKGHDYFEATIAGHEQDEAQLKAFLESQVAEDADRRGQKPWDGKGMKPASELRVMIRADQAALYSYVQRAMNSCADAGIYKIEIGAAQVPPEEEHAK